MARIVSLFVGVVLCSCAHGRIIYVEAAAAGTRDGTSWVSAYACIQDALTEAENLPTPVTVRVAQGIYRPSDGLDASDEFDWRTAALRLVGGVRLEGGYAGLGEPDPNARDVDRFVTMLSGDLYGDDAEVPDVADLLAEPTRGENSYHVVAAFDIESLAVMDGFLITGGNAGGEQDDQKAGGGLYCENARLEILNCTFRNHTCSTNGAAIYCGESGQVTMKNCRFLGNNATVGGGAFGCLKKGTVWVAEDCTFTENRSGGSGGAILTGLSDPVLRRCTFERNYSARGGGIYNFAYGNPTLVDCVFAGNSASDFGGGMYNGSGDSVQLLLRCTFTHNTAGWYGGGFYNSNNARPIIENCLFVGNSSDHWGGALHFWKSAGEIRNCTLADNSAGRGGALACGFEDQTVASEVRMVNCILWGNGEETYNDDDSRIATAYCCIAGLVPGRNGLANGNISQDPYFVAPGRWVHADDPNQIVAPGLPGASWVEGDYHLKSQAGRWDAALGLWIADGVTSPGIDAGDPTEDVRDEPAPNGRRLNLGAYGGTVEASKSPGP